MRTTQQATLALVSQPCRGCDRVALPQASREPALKPITRQVEVGAKAGASPAQKKGWTNKCIRISPTYSQIALNSTSKTMELGDA